MLRAIRVCVVFGVGAAFGRLFDSTPSSAAAGGAGRLPPCHDINADGSSDISDAAFLLNFLFLGGPEPICPTGDRQDSRLPDTGQRTCYGEDGTVTSCDSFFYDGGVYVDVKANLHAVRAVRTVRL